MPKKKGLKPFVYAPMHFKSANKKRSKKKMCYKGPTTGRVRCGHPVIHVSKAGKKFIMVRKVGGGTKRLYLTKFGNIPEKYRP